MRLISHKPMTDFHNRAIGRYLACGLAVLTIVIALAPAVTAAAISQGYRADTTLDAGTLVSIQEGEKGKAVPADTTNSSGLLGIVIGNNEASLAVSSPGDLFQVATSGQAEMFVSDLNGEIKPGDVVAPSPIKGVGMRATEAGKVVGVAQGEAKYGSKTVDVKSSDGTTKTAKLGSAIITLQVSYYVPPVQKTYVPQFLQLFANQIAGKQVSLLRIVLSAIIVFAALVAAGVLLFTAVRSTMVSIGRNPLARSSIYRGLWQVVIASLIIVVLSMGAAYLVLTR